MHPLHEYIAKQLAEKLKAKKIVVWYDARCEFAPFVAEMRGSAETSNEPLLQSLSPASLRSSRSTTDRCSSCAPSSSRS